MGAFLVSRSGRPVLDMRCEKIFRNAPGYVAAHGAKIARLARLENLEAHARSVECRLKNS